MEKLQPSRTVQSRDEPTDTLHPPSTFTCSPLSSHLLHSFALDRASRGRRRRALDMQSPAFRAYAVAQTRRDVLSPMRITIQKKSYVKDGRSGMNRLEPTYMHRCAFPKSGPDTRRHAREEEKAGMCLEPTFVDVRVQGSGPASHASESKPKHRSMSARSSE